MFNSILNSVGDVIWVLRLLLEIVGLAAIVATVTKTRKDDAFLSRLQNYLVKGINFLGANFGNAKNAKD